MNNAELHPVLYQVPIREDVRDAGVERRSRSELLPHMASDTSSLALRLPLPHSVPTG